MSGASSTAPPTASVNPYDRPKAKLAKSRAEVSSNGKIQSTDGRPNVQSLDQPETLLRCHLCPEVQGTFLAVRAHIKEHHGGQPLRFECNECGLQKESPSLLRLHQIRDHIANATKTAKPGNAEAARPAATGSKAITGPTEKTFAARKSCRRTRSFV
jgi:hypothetical protein